MDFSTWTRADFLAFDAARAKAFELTPEEMAENEARAAANREAKVSDLLAKVGMDTKAERDRAFLLDFAARIDAKQFVGENVEKWVDAQIAEFPTPKEALEHFIVRYL